MTAYTKFPPQQRTKRRSNNPVRGRCDWVMARAWVVIDEYSNAEKAFEFYKQSLYWSTLAHRQGGDVEKNAAAGTT
ncbi:MULTISPECIES: hypothetical protein [unclassified Sphingobium]|uniref:hypothetical protein n=1 Tax=unclassified Sphingobium TaxID=2611147 RepID=UPI0022242CAA|nr:MULTISPECIES: hypothetical protein [unclassified Sphingobium]MCW2349296.1 hypothetical protein [Sphingobium sp. B12D2B]MCW2368398.1 hypothetical protein [Sphingobium sp. B11D3D]